MNKVDYMIIELDLQLFSEGGEKTEEPTPKKRRDAREKGQVVQSKEINTVVILASCFVGLKYLGSFIVVGLNEFMIKLFGMLEDVEGLFSRNNLMMNTSKVMAVFAINTLPILFVAFIASLIVNYLQVGILYNKEALQFKLDRLNPVEGFKRMFSKKAIMELIKSIFKIGLVGFIGYKFLDDNMHKLIVYPNISMNYLLSNFSTLTFEFLKKVLAVLFVLAVADYVFQWRSHEKNLMMSKQEIKEEYKQSEGDPAVKGKIKQKQREMAMGRMMQSVPEADVIITNPTHYAIAIKYDPLKFDAPYVLAKGADLVAQKIKEIGKENDIPLVENKVLARTMYATVDINEFIPEELYELVAEVLAYVYSLEN